MTAADALADRPDPDVLVIGGGVVGLFCAYFLSLAGAAVTVAERGQVGGPQSCSAANTGFVGTQGTAPLAEPRVIAQGIRWLAGRRSPFAIRPALSGDLAAWLWQFRRLCNESDARACAAVLLEMKRRSLEILREIGADGPLAGTFAEPGIIVAFRTARGFDQALAAVPRAVAAGVPLRALCCDELAALEPGVEFDIYGALFNAEGAVVRTPELVTGLAALARQAGAVIMPQTEVTGFELAGGRVTRVRVSRREVAARELTPREVVIAAGAWTTPLARILGVRLLQVPARGYTVTVPAPPAAPRRPVLLSEGKVAVLPLGDQLRFGGTLELGARAASVSRTRVAGIAATVGDYLPGLRVLARGQLAADAWAGLRPCTPDSLPFLGRAGPYQNVSVACGHGYIGMGLAPVSGRIIAQLLTGQRPELDLVPLRPDRFGEHSVFGYGPFGRAGRDGGPR